MGNCVAKENVQIAQIKPQAHTQSTKLILGYWKNRGRAQACQKKIFQLSINFFNLVRYLLEFLELPYEEKRYTLDAPQEWFGKDKVQYQNNPLANIPYIKDGDKVIFESISLATYIVGKSNKLELLGTDLQQEVALETIYSVLLDIQNIKYKYFLIPQENYVKENFLKDINPFLAKLEFIIHGKEWATGKNITYIDFNLFEVSEFIKQQDQDTFNKYPNIVALNKKITQIPQIQNYLKSDRFLSSPFMQWF